MQTQLESFRLNGGFTENMTAERIAARHASGNSPACPSCGKPMLKRMQKREGGAGEGAGAARRLQRVRVKVATPGQAAELSVPSVQLK